MDSSNISYFSKEETTIILPKSTGDATTIDIAMIAKESNNFKLKFSRVSDQFISKASVGLQLMDGSSSNSNALIGVGVVGALAFGGGLICKKRKQTENYVSKADDDY